MNNLNLIIGTDSKQIDFYLLNILKKITYIEDNKITYDLSINSLSDILDEASMISLFSDNKVIIGNNFDINKLTDDDITYLKNYLTNINESAYIILIADSVDARKTNYKLLKEHFNIIDTTKADNIDDIYKYVLNRLKECKYKLNDINYFLDKVGKDINNINLELDKLMLYKADTKVITISDIDLLIVDNIDNIIYEFTNAFLEDDTDKIVKMYHNFKLQNVTVDYLIVSIANTLRQALTIKLMANEGKNNSDIAKIIGKKEFYVKKMLERIYRYSESQLAGYITKLALIDKNIKIGNSTDSALELFLIDKDK